MFNPIRPEFIRHMIRNLLTPTIVTRKHPRLFRKAGYSCTRAFRTASDSSLHPALNVPVETLEAQKQVQWYKCRVLGTHEDL